MMRQLGEALACEGQGACRRVEPVTSPSQYTQNEVCREPLKSRRYQFVGNPIRQTSKMFYQMHTQRFVKDGFCVL
jgi:hypothetical protein